MKSSRGRLGLRASEESESGTMIIRSLKYVHRPRRTAPIAGLVPLLFGSDPKKAQE